MEVKRINAETAKDMLNNDSVKLVDIRDENSFTQAHIEHSFHLTNDNISQFMREYDFDTQVIVCCYHGVSSLNAAQYLIHQGYEDVYSLDGGFEHWRKNMPFVTGNA